MSREEAEYSVFEIPLKKGVNEHTLALYGLGNALGWPIKERVAFESDLQRGEIPRYMEVSPDDLSSISAELWGTEVYGQNAAQFLDEERRNLRGYPVTTRQAEDEDFIKADSGLVFHYGNEEDRRMCNHKLGIYPKRLPYWSEEQERLEELVAKIWPRTPFPFESPKVFPSEKVGRRENEKLWDFQVGPVSRLRLAHYARSSGIAKHTLRGAVGKTHDVINVAAGLIAKEEVTSKSDAAELEFIDYQEFKDRLKSSGLAGTAQREIVREIYWSLGDQIKGGITGSWRAGDVIVEGAGGWVTRGGQRVPEFEKIARVSLAHLFDDESKTSKVAPRQFLAQFV